MDDEADRLASILIEARKSNKPVDGSKLPWSELYLDLAEQVGLAFASRAGATGSPYWKLGAVDESTQQRLGVEGPLFAPLNPKIVSLNVTTAVLELSSLIEPKFEPEIGVHLDVDGMRVMPCVEIADCRFQGWALPPCGVLADGALQGRMLFGLPVDPIDTVNDMVNVTVLHDGRDLSQGTGSWSEAVDRLGFLPHDHRASAVATGALTDLNDCAIGLWTFDFGSLGQISVRVI
jgi:2-keto-4-pentenoate hydratase